MKKRNVAVLIFDEVEVLDFCGPFEVFSVTGKRDNSDPFNVYTVAQHHQLILARNALCVKSHFDFNNCPTPDILVVPGGFGTRKEMNNPVLIEWIREVNKKAELMLSVCTGALILAKAGLLDGLSATTHHGAVDLLKEVAPKTHVDASKRFIDNGRVILSAGISAGLDMSLHVVAKLLGKAQAIETAQYMEYRWETDKTDHDF
ncbi:DJ-1/PfpI family protein [bacterium]|nr:DJ-1/PfpI family protein [bacterium]